MHNRHSFTGWSERSPLSALSPFSLVYCNLETTFAVPDLLRSPTKRARDGYLNFLSAQSSSTQTPPSSEPELFARFFAYVVEGADARASAPLDSPAELSRLLLEIFELTYLKGEDVHTFASELACEDTIKQLIIRSYYNAILVTQRPPKYREPALFKGSNDENPRCLYMVFGGQGNTEHYFEELRDAYTTYPSFLEDMLERASTILFSLAKADTTRAQQYPKALDFMRWLRQPESTPPTSYLLSAPVSFPLIGLVQLVHYCVTCKVLRKSPGELLSRFAGLTGHSQGTVVAAAIATASTWEGFDRAVESALTTLFYIGYRSQQIYPETLLSQQIVQDSISAGEGVPSPMLNIMNLSQSQVQDQVDELNKYLSHDKQIMIVLINGARNIVVGGPPLSLVSFNNQIRRLKVAEGADQSRTPFRERKLEFSSRFLPITVPFHSSYLETAEPLVEDDLKRHRISLKSSNLKIPVYHTNTGQDLQDAELGDLLPELGRSVMTKMVDWPRATAFPGATHIVDFGPGGTSGVGTLLQRSKEGTGVHVILGGPLNGTNSSVGYKAQLFEPSRALKYGADWSKDYAPGLLKDSSGRTMLATKMSRLLGIPPLMVAGMTPTTVHYDFVAAIMNAGYHAEIAAGGYNDPGTLTKALKQLQEAVPVGRGITINLIYSNPRAMQWQIPLIRQLKSEGLPIDGITLGAGVPSLDVATDYIRNLGLKHIAFKPGMVDTIQDVINIAKANPSFPVMLQWTGGRGGGHHSFEDFHEPILQMYGKIRNCSNIVLVAGSGFGEAEAYPYISGTWSRKFGRADMPFDGCLFGSRMMVAKEAHTSEAAKIAIANVAGLEDEQWQETYKRAAGGIVTVNSELGQPIHKIATRGVLLWAELDKTIFSLPKPKQVVELNRRKDYYIQKLNKDSQKVWFGRNSEGEAVDLEDMTYAEVLRRLVELLYVKHQSRWIHESHRVLVADYLQRIEERLSSSIAEHQTPISHNFCSFLEPFSMIDRILDIYPDADTQLISAEDAQYFLSICRRRGQKPVTFIPVIDEQFETWFKKDSLWQSEDLDAVVDQDVQRTCILQGPVAARNLTQAHVNEPVKVILDRINNEYIERFHDSTSQSHTISIPSTDYFHEKAQDLPDTAEYEVHQVGDKITYTLHSNAEAKLPTTDSWLNLLAGDSGTWRHALFRSDSIVQSSVLVSNPVRRMFAPKHGISIDVALSPNPNAVRITMNTADSLCPAVDVKIAADHRIIVSLISAETAEGRPVPLDFIFEYRPDTTHALIHEVMDGRNDRIKSFYNRIWLGSDRDSKATETGMPSQGAGQRTLIDNMMIKKFAQAIGSVGEDYIERLNKAVLAPMDFAIVAGWKSIVQALLSVDGDLLRLVHLSNKYRLLPGAQLFKPGDEVCSSSVVTAILIQDSGKLVEITCTLTQAGVPVQEIVSQFLYRGSYTDFSQTFEARTIPTIELSLDSASQVELLTSKQWFVQKGIAGRHAVILGAKLTFDLKNIVKYKTSSTYASVRTIGKVFVKGSTSSSHEPVQVATVDYRFRSSENEARSKNPVLDYLQRHGNSFERRLPLEQPVSLGDAEDIVFTAPASNDLYSRESKDFNPIHVSTAFASYADLPGTITHGMHTNAIVRGLCEAVAAEGKAGAIRTFDASFCGMVLPGDEISVEINHVAMIEGRKVITVKARNRRTEEVILTAESEVDEPRTAYLFTGQGSQEAKMGMDLYATSKVAREVWDRADKHFDNNYGKSNLAIPMN